MGQPVGHGLLEDPLTTRYPNGRTLKCCCLGSLHKKEANLSTGADENSADKMFKKFSEKDSVSGSTQLKSSVIRNLRHNFVQQYPHVEPYFDEIWPKKDNVKLVKCQDHIELIASQTGEILFFKQRDGVLLPTLRVLHKYPFILPWMQVDKGAIKFVLSGANIMCPGMTSAGGKMSVVPRDTPVLIVAEGKQHALAIGVMKLSTEEIKKTNKGIGVDILHFLNDGLWQLKAVK